MCPTHSSGRLKYWDRFTYSNTSSSSPSLHSLQGMAPTKRGSGVDVSTSGNKRLVVTVNMFSQEFGTKNISFKFLVVYRSMKSGPYRLLFSFSIVGTSLRWRLTDIMTLCKNSVHSDGQETSTFTLLGFSERCVRIRMTSAANAAG